MEEGRKYFHEGLHCIANVTVPIEYPPLTNLKMYLIESLGVILNNEYYAGGQVDMDLVV